MQLQKAQRQQAKIKLAIQGPSGSGKTYSALLLAKGMVNSWDEVVVIDTEHGSAHLYAAMGDYHVLDLKPPFTPEAYGEAIDTCLKAQKKVIILDSISHEWDGQGGILDIHGSMPGNSFTNWNKVTPRHNAFVQAMLQADAHIIATIRTKQDYVLSDKNGKMVPEKVGLKGITRDGLDYEFTLVFDLNIKHQAECSKDRTGLFMDQPPHILTPNTGKRILSWCKEGKSVGDVEDEINSAADVDTLRRIYKANPTFQNQLMDLFLNRKKELENGTINSKPNSHGGN